jgi:hypothetical protein
MNTESTIICDNNDIILEKNYNDDENEHFHIFFNCMFDKSSNIIKIIEKNKFYDLLSQLNPDIIDEFLLDSLNDKKSRVLMYFNEKYDNKDIAITYDEKITKYSDNHIELIGLENDFNNLREGYEKFNLNYLKIDFNIQNDNIDVNVDFIINSDDLVNDIIAMMIKKQIFRLKKYIELE